jgi:hypothetical protein
MKKVLFFLLLCWNGFSLADSVRIALPVNDLEKARLLFYASVDNGKLIDSALVSFNRLAQQQPSWQFRAQTYVGALTALKGKHALLPTEKLKWTKKGLKLMDQGLAENPDDIESLFIHGMTCYFLPFFFKRHAEAEKNLKKILFLLPERHSEYDLVLLQNAFRFIAEQVPLDNTEKKQAELVKTLIFNHGL